MVVPLFYMPKGVFYVLGASIEKTSIFLIIIVFLKHKTHSVMKSHDFN